MNLNKLPYNNVNLKTNKILEQLTYSSRALAELKGYANTIPNMHILINAVTINEAKDNKRSLENIVKRVEEIGIGFTGISIKINEAYCYTPEGSGNNIYTTSK